MDCIGSEGQIVLFSQVRVMIIFMLAAACCFSSGAAEAPARFEYRVEGSLPHDKNAQTEGLIIHEGFIYEGTGPCLDGPSSLRKLDMKTGETVRYMKLSDRFFGEGVTIFGDRIIQLTYRAETGFVYDLNSFRKLTEFHYEGEGWGLTHDEENLIMSNGTSVISYLNPVTFEKVKELSVRDEYGDLSRINELEYINGYIYANVHHTPYIVLICPETGKVVDKIDLFKILKKHFIWSDYEEPANGIAYDFSTGIMYVTGKYWPKIYMLRVLEK